MQKIGMQQIKADPCMFRKMVNGEVSLIVCVHVDDIAIATKGKYAFDGFNMKLTEDYTGNLNRQYIVVPRVCVQT